MRTKGRISIVLADDHPIVRKGLRSALDAEGDFDILGEEADGLKVVDFVDRTRPDVLVLDLMMPGLNGLEITRQVVQRVPKTRVVIVSMRADEESVLEALRNGAIGYVLKDAHASEIILALREAAADRRYLGPSLAGRAIEAYAQQAKATPPDAFETLTAREREIFQLISESANNTEAAARLGISPRTVETHRANLMRKLGIKSQTDLIRYALRRGIVPLDT